MVNFVKNFDAVKGIKPFNPEEYNEFFLKAVTDGVSKSTGNPMWTLHFLPVEKDSDGVEKNGRFFFPNALIQYLTFNDKGEITNKNFIVPMLSTLCPGVADIREVFKKSVGKKGVTFWIKQKVESYNKNDGTEGLRYVLDKYSKTKPTDAEVAAEIHADNKKKEFNKELKQKSEEVEAELSGDLDDEDDLPF